MRSQTGHNSKGAFRYSAAKRPFGFLGLSFSSAQLVLIHRRTATDRVAIDHLIN